MKKIFTLLVSLCTLSAVFAQNGGNYYPQQRDGRTVSYQDKSYQQPGYGNSNNATYGHYDQQANRGYGGGQRQTEVNRANHDYDNRNTGYGDRQRQPEMDRNHDYDNRNGSYRNDHAVNDYDRNNRYHEMDRERNGKLKSIGTGVLLGGIIGVLIGTHL